MEITISIARLVFETVTVNLPLPIEPLALAGEADRIEADRIGWRYFLLLDAAA